MIFPSFEMRIREACFKYLPFKPTCEFYSWNTASDINKLFFSVKPRGLKNACFELDGNYCKLKTITCEEDRIDF